MNVAMQMLEARHDARGVDHAALALAIDGLTDAAAAATACADACLSAPGADDRADCIKACADAADVASATARVLARTGPTIQGSRALVDATSKILSEAAGQCADHSEHHKHARISADTLTRAQQALAGLQAAVAAVPGS